MCDAQTWSLILIGCFALGQMVGVSMLLAGYLLRKQWLAMRKATEPVTYKRGLRAH
jgi:hypothetical protein